MPRRLTRFLLLSAVALAVAAPAALGTPLGDRTVYPNGSGTPTWITAGATDTV